MKALIVCVIVCACSMHLKAQSTNNSVLYKAKPTKGYYSIYNNAAKLSGVVTDSAHTSTAQTHKGYFSIGNNKAKLLSTRPVHANNQGNKHEVKKGYYSIGNNQSKLN